MKIRKINTKCLMCGRLQYEVLMIYSVHCALKLTIIKSLNKLIFKFKQKL